jgi:hypothetical protein
VPTLRVSGVHSAGGDGPTVFSGSDSERHPTDWSTTSTRGFYQARKINFAEAWWRIVEEDFPAHCIIPVCKSGFTFTFQREPRVRGEMDNITTDKEIAFSLSVTVKLEFKLVFIVENTLLLYIFSVHR